LRKVFLNILHLRPSDNAMTSDRYKATQVQYVRKITVGFPEDDNSFIQD
jgi:hypothetical protein